MTLEEYKEKLLLLDQEYSANKKSLLQDFVFSNTPYKYGDTVTDHAGSIFVESIMAVDDDPPHALYRGVILNKDGSMNKKGKKRYVWQTNIV